MPAIPGPEKDAFLELVKVMPYPGGTQKAEVLDIMLNNYEDIANAINGQLYLFCENVGYLTEVLAVFDDNELQAVGIYNNKISASPLSDPVLIVNSTYTGGITITANQTYLMILNESSVNEIVLGEGVYLDWLFIFDSSVTTFDSSAYDSLTLANAMLGNLFIPYINGKPGYLYGAVDGSRIGNITGVAADSYFGGILDYDPNQACSNPVTDLAVSSVTHDSITITWTLPASPFLSIKPFYRQTNTGVWIEGTEANGFFMQNAGFVFTKLKSDTYYDFMVRAKCTNGGAAEATANGKTPCCGSGQMSLWKPCPITILIKDVPDPGVTQTLCNGVTIAKEYPSGATITIPYLASSQAVPLEPFILDNIPYQNMPYNPATGIWDASSTPILTFVDGSIVTVNVSVPA